MRGPGGLSPQTWERLSELDPTTRGVAAALLGGDVQIDLDPGLIQADITRRVLEAPTAEDALKLGEAVNAEDYLDIPFVLRGFRFQESSFEEGPPVFAAMDVADPNTGETFVLTCGSVNVMAQIIKLQLEESLPREVKIVRSQRETRRGFSPMWLVAAQE